MKKILVIAGALVIAAIVIAALYARRTGPAPVEQQGGKPSRTVQDLPLPPGASLDGSALDKRGSSFTARLKGYGSAFRVSVEPLEVTGGSGKPTSLKARVTDNGTESERVLKLGDTVRLSEADLVMDDVVVENFRGSGEPSYLFSFSVTLR